MLNRIRIVLVHTSHPGNIGAVSRAMKTMGLSELVLVAPKEFPHTKANEMASGALDILHAAKVVETLEDAIGDCELVVGTSARIRAIPWPLYTPRNIVSKLSAEPSQHKIAIVFGREQSGLTNEELEKCHLHMTIPANPEYSSLNIASAVQVVAYELRIADPENLPQEVWDCRLANSEEMENFFSHLQKVLIEIDFLKMSAPRKLMTRLRRLFLRTRPDEMEINILRGILTAIENDRRTNHS